MKNLEYIGAGVLFLLLLAFVMVLAIGGQRNRDRIARQSKARAAYLRGKADAYRAQGYDQQAYPQAVKFALGLQRVLGRVQRPGSWRPRGR